MDATRLLLELAADLLTQLDVITVEPAAAVDDFQDTVPAVQHGRVDIEVGDA